MGGRELTEDRGMRSNNRNIAEALEILYDKREECPDCNGTGSVEDEEGLIDHCYTCQWIYDLTETLTNIRSSLLIAVLEKA